MPQFHGQKLQCVSMRYASSRHSSSRLGPSAAGGNGAPALIACQRARKIGVKSSNSAQSASSPLAAGSSCVATVAAIRNLAGHRFSATSRYHDNAPRIAGSSQTLSWAKSLMRGLVTAPCPGGMPACIVVESMHRFIRGQACRPVVSSADDLAAAASRARVQPQRSRSPHPILARVVRAQNLADLFSKTPVSSCPQLVAVVHAENLIVRLGHRDLVWINVTAHPTAEWVARQIMEAFPWNEATRYMIRDRDWIYGAAVARRLRAIGFRDKPIAPASPWQNGFAERLIG